MNLPDIEFLIQTERRREEMALATQHLMVKEAQRAGMKNTSYLSEPSPVRRGQGEGNFAWPTYVRPAFRAERVGFRITHVDDTHDTIVVLKAKS